MSFPQVSNVPGQTQCHESCKKKCDLSSSQSVCRGKRGNEKREMPDQGKLHSDTKSGSYRELTREGLVRQCLVSTEDWYEDKKSNGYIHKAIVQIGKEDRRKSKAKRN